MARIDVLPSIEIIRGLKGILDFYLWRGLPCVRAWPKYRPAKQTAASLAAALTFGAIVKAYSLLAPLALEAYREDALDQPRTARDIMVTGAYGNLHEASMSDFLDALIIIRDAIVAQTALLNALHSIDTDELVVRTEHSVLPDGAATAAAQATQLTALQKLDDLQDALQSKALDRVIVRGQDQLWSILQSRHERFYSTNADAGDNTFNFTLVPAGQLWILTSFIMWNTNTAITRLRAAVRDVGGTEQWFAVLSSPGVYEPLSWTGWLPMATDERIRAKFDGCAAGDDIYALCHFVEMTKE